jgi:fructokinase
MRVGLDIGGTKIAAIGLDDRGQVVASARSSTPRTYAATLSAVGRIVGELESQRGEEASRIGISLPGVVDTGIGMVHAVNLPWLGGRPFANDLAMVMGRPVRIVNDANAFVLSEAVDGAAAGAAVVFGIIIGTGVGGGLVIDRKIIGGANGLTGEWGHTPLPWRREEDGMPLVCSCGKTGCVETVLSGSGLSALYRTRTGRYLQAHEIAERAEEGEAAALETLAAHRHALARCLGMIVNVLDPEVIVVGGGLSELPRLIDDVQGLWSDWTLVRAPRTKLVKALHGADSGVRGGAWLWERE